MKQPAQQQYDRLRLLPSTAEYAAWRAKQSERRQRINAARDVRYAITDRLLETNNESGKISTVVGCHRGAETEQPIDAETSDERMREVAPVSQIGSRFLLALAYAALVTVSYLAALWWMREMAGGSWRRFFE